MERMMILSDPQTSGGLLIACAPEAEEVVCRILLDHGHIGHRIGFTTDHNNMSMISIL